MVSETAVWLIIGLPLFAGLGIVGLLRPWSRSLWQLSGYVAVAAVGGAFVLSLWAFKSVVDQGGEVAFEVHRWLDVGAPGTVDGFSFTVGVLLDPLTAIMVSVVSGVSLLVQVYSLGYMRKGDDEENGPWSDYPRYFSYMSLFTAAMLGLVLAYNLIQMFVFWELVGLMSYLLIGFWYHRPAAAAAAKKAFIVTRIGDFGFMLALLYLFFHRAEFVAEGLNPFEIPDIIQGASLLSAGVVTWVALGLFAGAVGKSAQLPLNTWLPDAMEGPTPVSSLIHAATMVAAGVFLVARMFPLFAVSTVALNTVAIVGGLTAITAAAMGLVTNDIKRVLAFSTVSQLGYMFLALGVGAPMVAIFHLFNHAFFKCLLFLGAGSVHHSVHTFDMRHMGGLWRHMPITYVTTLVAGLSLAGIFPFAGFWSKDEVLSVAWTGEHAGSEGVSRFVFWLALIAAAMTAFYVFRLIIMTFHGRFRGGIEAEPVRERIPDEAHHQVHRAESPWQMVAPMFVLSLLAIVSGYLVNPFQSLGPVPVHWFSEFLGEASPEFNSNIAWASTGLALGGISLAVMVYGLRWFSLSPVRQPWAFAHQVLEQRFYMDYLYETLIVRRVLYRGVFLAADWFDRKVVDGAADLVSWVSHNGSRAAAQLQTGQIQAYGVGVSTGVIILLVVLLALE
ncbi:MAG: NADH-quinone oxidoreductase subunit L [Dehalococcoidia bacterium]